MHYFNLGKALGKKSLALGRASSVQVDREGRNCWRNAHREQSVVALSPVSFVLMASRLPGKAEQAQPDFHGPAGSCSEEKEVALLHLLCKRN